jgi:hypothetical protein
MTAPLRLDSVRSADRPTERVLTVLLWALLAGLAVHAAYYLWLGIDHPMLDYFGFRQTQTAITSYWLWHDGFRLVYETPVLGSPWAIPFEFPFYQWLVALLRVMGVPIDIGGRLVTFAFFVGTLYPLWILAKALNLPVTTWLIVAILFLASPFYVFWGRTVMIESCALFFGVLTLALTAQYLADGRVRTVIFLVLAATFAVLVKSTTFPAFAFLSGLLILAEAVKDVRGGGMEALRLRLLATAAGALLIALVIGWLWSAYADYVKSANPFGAIVTPSNIPTFFFGTWGERTSLELWSKVIWKRALHEILGYSVLLSILAAAAALQSRRYAGLMLASLAGFILPFLLFTHLHMVHNYYQNANALFVLMAVGAGVAAIWTLGQPFLASVVLALIVAGEIAFFQASYANVIQADTTKTSLYGIARAARQYVPEDEGLLALGNDWSSEVPYYAERKSLALPGWAPLPLVRKMLRDPKRFLGNRELGGVVVCRRPGFDEKAPPFAKFLKGRAVIATAGECRLLSATR